MRYLEPVNLRGIIETPPSKSQSHRVIIAASLATGESVIDGVELSDDINATIEGMRAFGADIQVSQQSERMYRLIIQGLGETITSSDQQFQNWREPYPVIQAKESGSTLRFLIPIAGLGPQPYRFVGEGNLGSRPLSVYNTIFLQQGLTFDCLRQDPLDLVVAGPLTSGDYDLPGQVSSQFVTGLLMTLPLLDGDSRVRIVGDFASAGYVQMTLQVLADFGISIVEEGEGVYRVPGNQSYRARSYTIEGDFSQGAVFLCGGILGHTVKVKGLSNDSAQPDRQVVDMLKCFGAMTWLEEDGSLSMEAMHRKGVSDLSGDQTPDIMPLLALVACLSEGESHLIHLGRLRLKESDRLAAVAEELRKLGATISIEGDSWRIVGQTKLQGGVVVDSHNDHRIAMMLALASTVCREPIYLTHSEVVRKSYPHFWEDWEALGGKAPLVYSV